MSDLGPLQVLPVACTLTLTAGTAQVQRWKMFDAEYALDRERTDSRLTIRYARTDDSLTRLRELVAAEVSCCAFVDWTIDDTPPGLRLIVTGTPEQLDALTIA